jgi:nucleoside-diphosphate kinase
MERTLILVKPDAMQRELAGQVIARFQTNGFKLCALKMLQMDRALAERHYGVHADKPFYGSLVDYITSGPIVAMVIAGDNAITRAREIMGATDPAKAAPGTIRADFGESIERNVVHGSDAPETALVEIKTFFEDSELCA